MMRKPGWELRSWLLEHPSYTAAEGVPPVILLEECQGLQVSCWFPCIVAFGVPKPLDKVLQLFPLPMMSVAANGLDFILFYICMRLGGGHE